VWECEGQGICRWSRSERRPDYVFRVSLSLSYLSMARTCSPFILCFLAATLNLTVSTLTLTPQSVSKLPLHTLELLLSERGVACNDCLHIDDYASLLLESQHLLIVLQRDQNKAAAKSAIPLPLSLQVQSDSSMIVVLLSSCHFSLTSFLTPVLAGSFRVGNAALSASTDVLLIGGWRSSVWRRC
jgi:UDP-N-acetylmuramyl tripeptide synthase